MAMPPGNFTPTGNFYYPYAPITRNWIPDKRDAFISRICDNFYDSNEIIDWLCQHLLTIGDHNEYEAAISSINYYRYCWSQAPYMHQFYPITEISNHLQYVAWRRQHQMSRPIQSHYNSNQNGEFGGRGSESGVEKYNGGYRGGESMATNGHNSNSDCQTVNIDRVENQEETNLASDEKTLSVAEEKIVTNGSEKLMSNGKYFEESESSSAENESEIVNHSFDMASKDNGLSSEEKQEEEEKECSTSTVKTFFVEEMYNAEMINVVEGLKLYDKILDENEISQLLSLVNNLRSYGIKGQFQSETYKRFNRPIRGHGREMIQLGLPIADTPLDDESFEGGRFEPIPSVLLDIIERLVSKEILPVKPDACIIDFFNEGDYSQPHMFVPWFGRPVGVLSLSECDFVLGRTIVGDRAGDYNSSLKLSLTPGSVLMVEGKSADLSKFAINSTRNNRILITLTKSQLTESNRFPPPSRSMNHHNGYSTGSPRHCSVISTTGLLPTPSHYPSFIVSPPPLGPSMLYPFCVPPEPMVWPLSYYPQHQAPPPPQPPMRPPGTGVFIPPSSVQELVLQVSLETSNSSTGSNSVEGKLELEMKEEACNGIDTEKCDSGSGSGNGITEQLVEEDEI